MFKYPVNHGVPFLDLECEVNPIKVPIRESGIHLHSVNLF